MSRRGADPDQHLRMLEQNQHVSVRLHSLTRNGKEKTWGKSPKRGFLVFGVFLLAFLSFFFDLETILQTFHMKMRLSSSIYAEVEKVIGHQHCG